MGAVSIPIPPFDATALLGYLSSRPLEYVLSFSNGSLQGKKGVYQNHYEVGQIKDLPCPEFSSSDFKRLGELGNELSLQALHLQDEAETTHQYRGRPA